jgi:putative SOS response-associated peptidase YedK
MCYSIAFLQLRSAKYIERYKDILPPDWSKEKLPPELPLCYFLSGFSNPLLPIVKHDGIFLFEWGLIPTWTRDSKGAEEIQSRTLNAVGETVFDKPAFRKSIISQRCLLGVSGFYEWRDFNKSKYPYFIRLKSEEIFSLGCIYESWIAKDTGEVRNTFSILTTPANQLMEKIHNLKKRMPLIISKADEKAWIDPSLSSEQIKYLIKPYHETDMKAHTVSKLVSNARNDRNVPKALDEVSYSELSVID